MIVTIEVPDSVNLKVAIRYFQLLIGMKESGFKEPTGLETLGMGVIQALLKEGKLKEIEKKKRQGKKK